MRKTKTKHLTIVRSTIVIAFVCFCFGGFFYYSDDVTATQPKPAPNSQDKYSRFSHSTHIKQKLACDSCHKFPTANWDKVRSKDIAFEDVTDYPKHESCLNCHRQQFFRGKSPAICLNCHINPSPRNSARHPFANPRELFDTSPKGKQASSEFEVAFPHDKHIEIVSKNTPGLENTGNKVSFINAGHKRAGEESCSVCHKTYQPQDKSDDEFLTLPPKDIGDGFWLKKGTFKTGPTNHSACFTCHSADTGILPAPTDCGTCHKLKEPQLKSDFDPKLAEKISIADKEMLLDWRRRDSSGTFRHEWFSHAELSCATCHNVTAMNTTDAKTKKVQVLSCGGGGTGCHVTPTSDDGGILNFEMDSRKKDAGFQCVKCHISFGKSPIPDSHTKAISDIAKGAK